MLCHTFLEFLAHTSIAHGQPSSKACAKPTWHEPATEGLATQLIITWQLLLFSTSLYVDEVVPMGLPMSFLYHLVQVTSIWCHFMLQCTCANHYWSSLVMKDCWSIDCNLLNVYFSWHTEQCRAVAHVWRGQVTTACLSMQQLGGSRGMPPESFKNLDVLRFFLRQFLGQTDAFRLLDDRLSYLWISIYRGGLQH